MIPRISKGASAYGALAYDHGPGRRDEHTNPHKVAGNVPGRTWRERAKAIDQHARTARADVAKPLHRTSLRVSETDRALTDREWKQVANEYVQRMGFDKCPWEATRHADDHIHITVNRVQWDGKLAKTSHDYAKAQAASRHIEKRHGLEDASLKYSRARPQISKGEKESAVRRQVQPEREQLRDKLTAAERASDGTRGSYEKALTQRGVVHQANVSKSTGRVSGYSYGLDGHMASPKGEKGQPSEQVWFKGSQLGRDYTWQKTNQRLTDRRRELGEQQEKPGLRPAAPAEVRRRLAPATSSEASRPPMTREEAKQEAMRKAAAREQREPTPKEHQTQLSADSDTPTRKDATSMSTKPEKLNREEAAQEAERRAAERDQQKAREADRERDQEHDR